MPIRSRIAAALFLAAAPVSALAQTGPMPPALGDPAREALEKARDEVASAMAILAEPGPEDQGNVLAAAHRDVLDARGAMEQAITSGKAEAIPPDIATDRLHRAIDRVSEVARSLRQLNPPIPEASIEAALSHLEQVAADIEAATGQLEPVRE